MSAVRRAKPHDTDSVILCEQDVWESMRGLLPDRLIDTELKRMKEPEFAENLTKFWVSKDSLTLVAEEDGRVIGVALARMELDTGVVRLGFFGVMRGYRKKGVGSLIIRRLIQDAADKGAHKIYLFTSPALQDAIRLYVNHGFVPEGLLRRHAYGTDLIIYSKFIQDT